MGNLNNDLTKSVAFRDIPMRVDDIYNFCTDCWRFLTSTEKLNLKVAGLDLGHISKTNFGFLLALFGFFLLLTFEGVLDSVSGWEGCSGFGAYRKLYSFKP